MGRWPPRSTDPAPDRAHLGARTGRGRCGWMRRGSRSTGSSPKAPSWSSPTVARGMPWSSCEGKLCWSSYTLRPCRQRSRGTRGRMSPATRPSARGPPRAPIVQPGRGSSSPTSSGTASPRRSRERWPSWGHYRRSDHGLEREHLAWQVVGASPPATRSTESPSPPGVQAAPQLGRALGRWIGLPRPVGHPSEVQSEPQAGDDAGVPSPGPGAAADADGNLNEIDARAHRTGIVANFVHSLGRCPLSGLESRGSREGWVVCGVCPRLFAGPPSEAALMGRCLREEFVRLHEENDPLLNPVKVGTISG
jgi:hypothetical protein